MTGRFSHPGQVQVNTLIQWEWAPALSLSLTLTNKLTEPETLTKVLCDCQESWSTSDQGLIDRWS